VIRHYFRETGIRGGSCKTAVFVILNEVKDLSQLGTLDASRRSEWYGEEKLNFARTSEDRLIIPLPGFKKGRQR
jgi:hypothetical protein